MSYEISKTGGNSSGVATLALSGELCIFHVAEMKPRLLEHLEPGTSLDIDLSGLIEVDTAGAQLLLFAKRKAANVNCTLSFTGHSKSILDMIDLFNLGRDFGDPLLITASALARETTHES